VGHSQIIKPCSLVNANVVPTALVPASVIRNFPPARLEEVERVWRPERDRASELLRRGGLDPEHGHWDWRNKIRTTLSGYHQIIAVEFGGEVQGLMAVLSRPRMAVLQADRGPVLYGDYLENAPWNLKGLAEPPRLVGVGTVLMIEAVKSSDESGLRGRVGLHSLPQAEGFYESNCRMTRIGCDPNYSHLTYFE
jgi:hypothetical protein